MKTRVEEHEMTVTEDEMRERGMETISIVASIEQGREVAKAQRARLKTLGEIARTGKERRSIEVYDEDDERTWEVVTRAVKTGEEVKREKMTPEQVKGKRQKTIPGTDKPAPKERIYTAEEIHDKLAATIREACKKPKDRSWLDLHLAKGVPEATPEERKRAVTLHEEAARLAEQPDGKLLWIATPPAETPAPATH